MDIYLHTQYSNAKTTDKILKEAKERRKRTH